MTVWIQDFQNQNTGQTFGIISTLQKKDQTILNLQLSQFPFRGNAYKNNGTWSISQNW